MQSEKGLSYNCEMCHITRVAKISIPVSLFFLSRLIIINIC